MILLNYPVHSIIHTFLQVRCQWDQPLFRAGLSHVCLSRNLSHCSLVPLKQGLDANSTSATYYVDDLQAICLISEPYFTLSKIGINIISQVYGCED